MIKKAKQSFVSWSNEEMKKLLKVEELEGRRVIYEFVLSTGVRTRELLAISCNEVDFDK